MSTRIRFVRRINHAEYVEQRRRMMQDWADRLDWFEQGQIEKASRHLIVHLENAPHPAMPDYAPPQLTHVAWMNP